MSDFLCILNSIKMCSQCTYYYYLSLYNDDTSETEEVKETDRVTSDPGKTRPQQEIINMDRSFFESGNVGSFVPKETQKSCHNGNNGRKRKKVKTKS